MKGGTAELNTVLGIFANNGIKGAEGGTHLQNIILSLQNPTDKAADQMEALGLSVYDSEGNMRSMNDILGDLNKSMDGMTSAEKSNIISNIFNKTDLSSVNALLANTGSTWDYLQKSITNSGGAAQQMADTQLDNLQGQITILKSALEGLAISFGELLMPAIKQSVGWVHKFVDWLNGLSEGTKKTVGTIALLAAALRPVLIFIGKVISAVGTIMTVLFFDKNGVPCGYVWEHRFRSMLGRYNEIYKVQMPKITPHVCHHTYCSNMAKSGINPKTLQYLMGLSDKDDRPLKQNMFKVV